MAKVIEEVDKVFTTKKTWVLKWWASQDPELLTKVSLPEKEAQIDYLEVETAKARCQNQIFRHSTRKLIK